MAVAAHETRQRFASNVVFSMGAKVLYLATRLFLPPLTLLYVPLVEYGIWAACFILISYIGMSAFGISNVYVKYVAEYHAQENTAAISRLLSTGLILACILTLGVLIALPLILPLVVELFNVPAAQREIAGNLIIGTVAVFMLDLSIGSFAYVLHGLQRIKEETLVWVAAFTLEALAIAAFLALKMGVYALLAAFALRYAFSSLAYMLLARRFLPGLKLHWRLFDRASLWLFYGYGLIVQATGFLSMFLRSVEKVIAGNMLGVQATALFDLGEKLPSTLISVPSSLNAASLPAIAYLKSRGEDKEAARLYLDASRYIQLLTGIMMSFLAAFALPISIAWLGARPEQAAIAFILALFTLPFQLDMLTVPGSSFFRGIGKPVLELVYHLPQLAMVTISVGAGWLLFGPSVEMIAFAVGGSMVASSLAYIVFANRAVGVSQSEYLRDVFLPGILPYAIAAGITLLFSTPPANRSEALAMLAGAGILHLGACLLLFWLIFARREEKALLARLFRRKADGGGGKPRRM